MSKIKKIVKNIPILGKIIVRVRQKTKKKNFTGSTDYWKERYDEGGNSGQGSYNEFAEHKAHIINQFVAENNITSVMELGCGDGNQLSLFKIPSYVGYEVSESAIELCKKRYTDDSTKQFLLLSEYKDNQYDLTMSLDVVYCLVEDQIYADYLQKLFDSASNFVLVFSTNHDYNNHTNPHIKHRKFTDWVKKNKPEFKLKSLIENNLRNSVSVEVSDFYFFERIK